VWGPGSPVRREASEVIAPGVQLREMRVVVQEVQSGGRRGVRQEAQPVGGESWGWESSHERCELCGKSSKLTSQSGGRKIWGRVSSQERGEDQGVQSGRRRGNRAGSPVRRDESCGAGSPAS
jgi:hypothetical protein